MNADDDDDDEVQILETPLPSRKRSKGSGGGTLFQFGFSDAAAASTHHLPSSLPPMVQPAWGKLVDEQGAAKVLRLQRFLGFPSPPSRSLFTPSYRNGFNDAFNRTPGVGDASSFSSWGSGVRSTLTRGCLGFMGSNGRAGNKAAEDFAEEEGEKDDSTGQCSKAQRNFNFIFDALMGSSDLLPKLCPADLVRLRALRQDVSSLDLFWTCYHRKRTICRVSMLQQQNGQDDNSVLLQELVEKRLLIDVTQDETTLLVHLQDVLALLRADELSRLVTTLFGSAGNGRNTAREESMRTLETFITKCKKDSDPSHLRRKLGKEFTKWLGNNQQQQRQRQGQTFRLVRVEPSLAKLLQRIYALFFLNAGYDAEDAVVLLWNDLGALRFVRNGGSDVRGSDVNVCAAVKPPTSAAAAWEVDDEEEEEENEKTARENTADPEQKGPPFHYQPMGPTTIPSSYACFFDRLLTLTDAFELAVASGDSVTAYACLHAVSDVFIPPHQDEVTAVNSNTTHSGILLESFSTLEEHAVQGGNNAIGGRLHTPPDYRGLHHLPRPLFKMASSIMGRGIHLLERERKHGQAVHYLRISLEGTKDLAWSLRGHFHTRLVLDLGHSNRPGDALQACEEALADPRVMGEDRLFLQAKCMSMSVPPRRWKKPSFPARQDAPVLRMELGDLQNRRNGGKSLEDRVLDYLLGEGKDVGQWKGAHCENNLVLTLFGLLCWDVLWSGGEKTCASLYRNAPPEFLDCSDFLSTPARRQALDACVARLRNGEAPEMLTEVHSQHLGTLCIGVDWSTFTLSDLQAIAKGLGPEPLAMLCETLASNYSLFSHGFPDLFLWRNEEPAAVRLVEVKGPGDSLSHAQMYWIDRLKSTGVQVEVARVVEGGKAPPVRR